MIFASTLPLNFIKKIIKNIKQHLKFLKVVRKPLLTKIYPMIPLLAESNLVSLSLIHFRYTENMKAFNYALI